MFGFEWQKGYGAFTISYDKIESVGTYIRSQKERHRVKSFQEEYIDFLNRHKIEFRLEHSGIYRCPSAPPTQNRMYTNYVMLIDDRLGQPNGPPNLPGSAAPSIDPASAVIVIEVADSDIHWMEPRDVLLSELSMKINDRSKRSLSSYHGGACVAHADGSVEILDDATTEERLRELLTQ